MFAMVLRHIVDPLSVSDIEPALAAVVNLVATVVVDLVGNTSMEPVMSDVVDPVNTTVDDLVGAFPKHESSPLPTSSLPPSTNHKSPP